MQITDLVEFVDLGTTEGYWVERIEAALAKGRKNTYQEFVDQGFDIIGLAKLYEEIYLDLAKD